MLQDDAEIGKCENIGLLRLSFFFWFFFFCAGILRPFQVLTFLRQRLEQSS